MDTSCYEVFPYPENYLTGNCDSISPENSMSTSFTPKTAPPSCPWSNRNFRQGAQIFTVRTSQAFSALKLDISVPVAAIESPVTTETKKKPQKEPAKELSGPSGRQRRLPWLRQEHIDFSDESTLTRVNRTILQSSSVKEALETVEEMKAAGMNAANEGTFVALITVCRRHRQGERGLVVYEAMKQSQIRPGILTYNALISCCQQAQKVEVALKLKKEMEANGIKPDVVTYTALMALVIKSAPFRGRSTANQRFEAAFGIFQEMRERSIQPDVVTINTLLYGASKAKLPGKVLEVYGLMSACGVSPDSQTFRILLESVGASGRLREALKIFNEMKAMGIQPNKGHYNMLIEACATSPQPNSKKAWELFEELESSGSTSASPETLNHLITASFKGGDFAGALRAYGIIEERGIASSLSTSAFNKLIVSAQKVGTVESSFQMYGTMKERGFEPDAVTLGTLVTACARAGDLDRAVETFQKLQGEGIEADAAVYRALISAYGSADQWENAISTFESMRESCSEDIDKATYSAVFDACFGKDGVKKYTLKGKAPAGSFLATPGILAAMAIYSQAAEKGAFSNFSDADLSRCDLRSMSRSAMAVCILSWLQAVEGSSSPLGTDLVLVLGSDRGKNVLGWKQERKSLLFRSCQQFLTCLGLNTTPLLTLTIQVLSLSKEEVEKWSLRSADVAVN